MSRLFGALANAYGQYEGGRFKRKQYDDSQAQQALENQRRAFEFAATNGRLEEQMRLMQQQREDALQRQRELDVIGAQQNGYETATPEAAASAANAFMQSQGIGMPSGVVRSPATPVAQYEAEGMKFGDPSLKPREVQYASVGGRLMRYDPQREVNEQTSQAFQKYMATLSEKKMLQEQRAQDREDQIRLTAAMRQAPQPRAPRTQIIKNDKGEYVIVDLDQVGPTGLKAPVAAGASGAKIAAEAPMRAALKDLGAQVLAQGEAGEGLPAQSIMSRYLADKKGDYKATSLSRALTGAAYAKTASPELQRAQNYVDQVASVLLPLRGGKAITQGEKAIILGAVTVEPGETPAIRAQKMRAFETLIAPILAAGGTDMNQEIAEMRQRAAAYRKAQGDAGGSGAAPWERKKP